MKYYTHDRVSVFNGDSGALVLKLQQEGWKNLQYVAHDSWGDCRSPEVMGQRPMTASERKECDKVISKNEKTELAKLQKLAKKLGYDIVRKKG